MKEVKQNTQWHSAINSGIRIELEEYASDLQFEEEHKRVFDSYHYIKLHAKSLEAA